MADIITTYDAAIFAVIIDKPDEPIIVPEHHLPKQYYLLLKKGKFYCNHHNYGKAIITFDEVHEEADRKITDIFAGNVRHYYENELDQKEPETEFQKWLVELFNKLHTLTENNHIAESHFTEYGSQKIGKIFHIL